MAPEQKIQILSARPEADGNADRRGGDRGRGATRRAGRRSAEEVPVRVAAQHQHAGQLRIDPATGKLKPLSTAALPKGENAAFVGTDRTGRWLLSASYAAGKVVVHRLNDDGMIADAGRADGRRPPKTAHCIATDRDNRFVFVPHVAPNAVYQFRLDAATGKLTEAGKAPGGTDKAGPRHLAFHPTQDLAFTSDEQGSSITAYRFDPATGLKPVQTLSTLPADFKGQNTTAEVKVHPSGKFVWVSNRGHDSLAGFAIDGKRQALGAGTDADREDAALVRDRPDIGRFVFVRRGEGSGDSWPFLTVDQASSGQLSRRAHLMTSGQKPSCACWPCKQ